MPDCVAVHREGRGCLRGNPERLVVGKGHDRDALRLRLKRRGIELVGPHHRGGERPPLQDGRKLRRQRQRQMVERSFTWQGNFRRLLDRWEHRLDDLPPKTGPSHSRLLIG